MGFSPDSDAGTSYLQACQPSQVKNLEIVHFKGLKSCSLSQVKTKKKKKGSHP